MLDASAVVGAAERLLDNVRHGRFSRTMSAATAVAGVVTAVDVYLEHDKASFGNGYMWVPIAVAPLGAAAGVAGVASERMARTALPIASALVVLTGLQGTYLHARGVAQRPGGWRNLRYNLEMGPPVIAPMLVAMVGGMGLLAAVLRREP